MTYPDFTIPIEDRWAADFWLDEWYARYRETNDHAFKEAADAMRLYIDRNFDEEWADV